MNFIEEREIRNKILIHFNIIAVNKSKIGDRRDTQKASVGWVFLGTTQITQGMACGVELSFVDFKKMFGAS